MVRYEHELDVLDAHAHLREAALERGASFVGDGARVDERQWLAEQEPDVDRRVAFERNRDPVDHGLRACGARRLRSTPGR
jgi:hypothetical protein